MVPNLNIAAIVLKFRVFLYRQKSPPESEIQTGVKPYPMKTSHWVGAAKICHP
jgi:hypothetical protein